MRFKSTWIVIGIFAALAAYLYFVEEPRYEAKKEAEKKEGLLFPDLDTDKVTELVIERKGKGRARVKKGEDDKWFLVEPWDDRADDGRVRTLLSDLKNLKAKKEVAPADADMEPYGLDEPECTVTTRGVEVRLVIGDKNPVGDARYVRAGDGPVRVAKNYALSGFLRDFSDLRNKDVLESFPWSRLESVEIRRPGAPLVRLVKKDDRWFVEAPFQAEADPDAAERVADKLRWARVQKFLDEDREKAEEKLAKGLTVVLRAEGEAEPVTVRMAEVDGQVWADRTGRNALFTVAKDVLEAFRKDPDTLRRKKPVLTKTWRIKELELTLGDTTLLYVKENGTWKREGAEVQGEEKEKLQDLVRAFVNAEAEEVIAEPGPAAEYGLDEPVYTARIKEEKKEQTVRVAEKDGKVYARAGDGGPVYRMPGEYLENARALVEAATQKPGEAAGEGSPGEPGRPEKGGAGD